MNLKRVLKTKYTNKKVLVMGLGRLPQGSGISAAKFFVKLGAKVTVTDLLDRRSLKESLQEIKGLNIKYALGGHRDQDFLTAEVVIKNPSVHSDDQFLQLARENGAEILTDTNLFFQYSPAKIIGITGTRGKTTTTCLIYEILKQNKQKVYLGGNVGVSPLNFLLKLKSSDLVVLELSSFATGRLPDIQKSPVISVVTNILADHLNYYHSMNEYLLDKEYIWQFQKIDDAVILNKDNFSTQEMGKKVLSRRFWCSTKYFPKENGCFIKNNIIYYRLSGREEAVCRLADIQLLGEHNYYNVMFAAAVAKILGVKNRDILAVIKKFKGVANRLELIREIRGVKYYNDTTATTPQATIAALKSFSAGKIILLAGGESFKGINPKDLFKLIPKTVKKLILLPGKETESFPVGVKVMNLSEAVKLASQSAEPGDIILFSPGTTWLPRINEFKRGEIFRKEVGSLKRYTNTLSLFAS